MHFAFCGAPAVVNGAEADCFVRETHVRYCPSGDMLYVLELPFRSVTLMAPESPF